MATQTARELLLSIGKNPKLVEELFSRKNRRERIEALISHRVIRSESELPTREKMNEEMRRVPASSVKEEGMFLEATGAASLIAHGGSYETQGAASLIAHGGSYENQLG